MDDLYNILSRGNSYVLQSFVVVFTTLLVDYFQRKILKRLHGQLQKTPSLWDDAVVEALTKPLTLIIWVAGISFAVDIIQQETGKAVIFEAIKPVRDTAVIGSLAWFLIRIIGRVENNILLSNQKIDRTTADAIAKLLRISIVITAALVTMQTVGFNISGILAFGGISGIAVGFAAKDLLANFFGGLMIYLDRPFAIGDWIRSPDREIEGTVEHIGWRLTRIRTFDKRPIYVPNGVFANITVENPQRMLNRRIYETIGIRYEDAPKMEEIIRKVKEMLHNHLEIDTNQTMIVNLNTFGPSSLDFFVYTFTKTTDWIYFHEVKQDVLLKIIKIIEGEGAQTAFPTSTVYLAGSEKLQSA
ncbi:MAG: mechanosensitive ion channel family protein [Nitrospinota bacterium]|nr:mechanosensitive ion channel family protein [Nitrospinota bacterium]